MLQLPGTIEKQLAHHLVFFDDNGLSSSEANSVAGKAGDIADTVNRLLAQTGSYIKTTELDGKTVTLVAPKKIENLAEIAGRDGALYGLKAYLMEAIKAKNAVLDVLRKIDRKDFAEPGERFNRYDYEEADKTPEREGVTEQTVLGRWSLADRAEYYLLEAQVAHLGKKVHPNNVLDRLMQESFEGVRYEREELNSGQGSTKTHIAEVISVYTPDEAQTAFYKVHDLRRETERRLNFLKARLQNEFNAALIAAENEYQQKLAEYTESQKTKRDEDQRLESVLQARRLETVRAASNLKILVPDALVEIYNFVVNFDGRLV